MQVNLFPDVAGLIRHMVFHNTVLYRGAVDQPWVRCEVLKVYIEKEHIAKTMVYIALAASSENAWLTVGESMLCFGWT
jgi:hypothetical protein